MSGQKVEDNAFIRALQPGSALWGGFELGQWDIAKLGDSLTEQFGRVGGVVVEDVMKLCGLRELPGVSFYTRQDGR